MRWDCVSVAGDDVWMCAHVYRATGPVIELRVYAEDEPTRIYIVPGVTFWFGLRLMQMCCCCILIRADTWLEKALKHLWLRITGEWKALLWFMNGICWNCIDALTCPWKLFRCYRAVRPFMKCGGCGGWFQRQIIYACNGLCENCDSALYLEAVEACGTDDSELTDDDVPF